MSQLANVVTLLSLACGFVSVIFSLESHFTFASWAILISVVLDGIDGQVAKKITSPSEFGKELDSLVDVISFGIAPSVLGYVFIYKGFHLWAIAVLFAYLLCSVMRLARYNITAKNTMTKCFFGLPTTMSGGVIAVFILLYRRYTQTPPPVVFIFLVLALAGLMVSKVRYANLDGMAQGFSQTRGGVFLVAMTVVFAIIIFYYKTGLIMPEIGVCTLFALYVIFSPFLFRKIVYNKVPL